MTLSKITLALSFVLLTAGCGKVTGLDDLQGTGNLDQRQLKTASDQFCGSNQKLVPLSDGTDVPFGQLNFRGRIFAFSSKKEQSLGCIINSAMNVQDPNNDGTNMWFNINPLDNCLKNGSVWVVQSSGNNLEQNYSLYMIGDPYQRVMNMNGHKGLRGSYVRDTLGLQVLQCQNN